MNIEQDITHPEPAEQNLFLAMILGWLFPGLGHLYMRKFKRGLICSGCILALFFIGLFLCQWTYASRSDFPFYLSGKYGSGFVLLAQQLLTGQNTIDLTVHFHYFEIGILFISVAGLLNFITVLNLIDVKAGRSMLLEMEEREQQENNNEQTEESEKNQKEKEEKTTTPETPNNSSTSSTTENDASEKP